MEESSTDPESIEFLGTQYSLDVFHSFLNNLVVNPEFMDWYIFGCVMAMDGIVTQTRMQTEEK